MRAAADPYNRVSPSNDRAAEVDLNIDEILDNANVVRDMFGDDSDALVELQQIEQNAATYKAAFDRTTVLQAERNDLVAELTRLGPKSRKQLTVIMLSAYEDGDPEAAYYAGLAQQELMLGRFYEERFLLTNSVEAHGTSIDHLRGAKKQLTTLLEVLENSGRRRNATATIVDIDGYIEAAGKVKTVIEARNRIRTENLDVLGPQMQAAYGQILDDVVERQNTLGPRASAAMDFSLTLVAILSLIAFLVGAALAGAIARWTKGSVCATSTFLSTEPSRNMSLV